MRVMKPTLIALAAIIAWGTSAYAITVQKKRDTPGDPADVWALIGDFCAIKAWHSAVARCEEITEGNVTYRLLTLGDGAKIKEKLIDKDDTSYSYEIIESPLPVTNYKAKLSVEEDEDSPDRSEVHWEANFDAQGASDEDARKAVGDIFEEGVKGIKKDAIAAWDAKEAAGGVSKGGERVKDDDMN